MSINIQGRSNIIQEKDRVDRVKLHNALVGAKKQSFFVNVNILLSHQNSQKQLSLKHVIKACSVIKNICILLLPWS